MKTKREELTEIRDMVIEVSEKGFNAVSDTLVYRMFGSISKEQAQGLIMGLNIAIREVASIDNKI